MPAEQGTTLEAPGLTWGVKTSFLLYLARMPQTQVGVGEGAGYTVDREFWFPLTRPDGASSSDRGALRFEGEVSIVAHSGFLRLTLADPWVLRDGESARLSVRLGAGERVELLDLEWTEPVRHDDGTVSWFNLPARLAEAGVPVFNEAYGVGEEMDPVSIRSIAE